jgi:hypothetical protein
VGHCLWPALLTAPARQKEPGGKSLRVASISDVWTFIGVIHRWDPQTRGAQAQQQGFKMNLQP